MSYQVSVTDSLESIDPADWEHLTGTQPFSSQRWYQFARHASDDKPLFFLLRDQDQLVGLAVANFSDKLAMTLTSPFAQRMVSGLLRRYPLLLCQTHMANMSSLILPVGDETNALHALSEAMNTAKQRTLFVVLGYLAEKHYNVIAPSGEFSLIRMDNNTSLPIIWKTFEEYTLALGKSARRDMKRHNAKALERNITVEATHQFTQHTDRVLELVGNVFKHHRSEAENNASRSFLTLIEREMPDHCVMLFAWADGIVVGCGLLIYDQGVMGLAFLGLDYTYQYIYFQLFYAAIRYAIENNITLICAGTGAYPFKRGLNFQEVPAYIAFNSPHRALRWLGNYVARSIPKAQELTAAV